MRKTVLLTILLSLFLAPALHAEPGDIILKPSAKGEWKILGKAGQQVGILKSMEEGYSIQLPTGEYLGVILKSGQYQKPGRRSPITPDEARLYLDTLDAIQTLK